MKFDTKPFKIEEVPHLKEDWEVADKGGNRVKILYVATQGVRQPVVAYSQGEDMLRYYDLDGVFMTDKEPSSLDLEFRKQAEEDYTAAYWAYVRHDNGDIELKDPLGGLKPVEVTFAKIRRVTVTVHAPDFD